MFQISSSFFFPLCKTFLSKVLRENTRVYPSSLITYFYIIKFHPLKQCRQKNETYIGICFNMRDNTTSFIANQFAILTILCNIIIFQQPSLALPIIACRGSEDPTSVRKLDSWVDSAPLLGHVQINCNKYCAALNPLFDCQGACRVNLTNINLNITSDVKTKMCKCTSFQAPLCAAMTSDIICRCSTAQININEATVSFDALRDFPNNTTWGESDVTFLQDSDGFDLMPVNPIHDSQDPFIDYCNTIEAETNYPNYFETLSIEPRIYHYPQFLLADEKKKLLAYVCIQHCDKNSD